MPAVVQITAFVVVAVVPPTGACPRSSGHAQITITRASNAPNAYGSIRELSAGAAAATHRAAAAGGGRGIGALVAAAE